MNKKKGILLLLVSVFILIISCSFKARAETQLYDYYEGVDSWLSNSTSYAPDGGSFSGTPNPPRNGMRTLPDQSKTSDWDNFYDTGRYWCWFNNGSPQAARVQYDDNRWGIPHGLLCYLNDPGQHGQKYRDPSGIYNDYIAYYYVFYRRPKPKYISAQVNDAFYDGNCYWTKTGTPFTVFNKFYDPEGGNIKRSFLKIMGSGIIDYGWHNFNNTINISQASSHDPYATFIYGHDWEWDSTGDKAKFCLKINKNDASVDLYSSAQNGQGTCWHYGNDNSNTDCSSSLMEWVNNNITVKTDGEPPVIKYAPESNGKYYTGLNQLKQVVFSISDARSGCDGKTLDTKVKKNNGEWQDVGKAGYYKFPSCGTYEIRTTIADHVGNVAVKDATYKIINPVPVNGDLNVVQYDYKQDSNNYWVKPRSNFNVYTDGYFPSDYGIYPSTNYLAFAKNGSLEGSSATDISTTTGNNYIGEEYGNNFNFIGGEKAYQKIAIGNNYLCSNHVLSARNDGDKFKLFYKSAFMDSDGSIYSPDYTDSGKWIRVDGKAPTGVLNTNLDSNLHLSISATQISDNGGSGVKNLYAVVTDPKTGRSTTVNLHKDRDTFEGEEWSADSIDAYLFKSSKLKIDLYGTDNVGNTGEIGSNTVSLLTISAKIAPNPDLQGHNAYLQVTTTGYADTIKAYWPQEIISQDKAGTVFPMAKQIRQEPIHNDSFTYLLPLTTPLTMNENGKLRDPYTIVVEADNKDNGDKAQTTVQLDVEDNVLDGVKTEIIGTGYDRDSK